MDYTMKAAIDWLQAHPKCKMIYLVAEREKRGLPPIKTPEPVECIGYDEYQPILDADGRLPSERRGWI